MDVFRDAAAGMQRAMHLLRERGINSFGDLRDARRAANEELVAAPDVQFIHETYAPLLALESDVTALLELLGERGSCSLRYMLHHNFTSYMHSNYITTSLDLRFMHSNYITTSLHHNFTTSIDLRYRWFR
jgi:hypothetical protein